MDGAAAESLCMADVQLGKRGLLIGSTSRGGGGGGSGSTGSGSGAGIYAETGAAICEELCTVEEGLGGGRAVYS